MAGKKSHLLPASCCLVPWGMSAGTFLAEEGALDCVAHRRASRSMSLSWALGTGWPAGRCKRLLSADTAQFDLQLPELQDPWDASRDTPWLMQGEVTG